MSNRTASLKACVFAKDATTSIPLSPSVGVPYRNTGYAPAAAGNGWPFSTIVDSADFNEIMFRATGLLDFIEKYGGIIWSENTDYPVGSLVMDENFAFFTAIQASGPNNGGYQNPSQTAYWSPAPIGFADNFQNFTALGKDRMIDAMLELDWDNAENVAADGVVYQATRAGVFILRCSGGYGDVYVSKTLPTPPISASFLIIGNSYYRTGSLPGICMATVPKNYYYVSNVADATVLLRKFIPFKYSIANI